MINKKLIETAAKIIKNAYSNNGKILGEDVMAFYKIPQKIRFEAQKYVNAGLM